MDARKAIAGSIGAGLLVVLAVVLAARATGADTSTFTRDPAVIAGNLPFYAGSVSILTCVAWGVAAALALFVATIDRTDLQGPLRLFGLLTLLLLADDALLLHEAVGPGWGLPEYAFGAVYAGLAAVVVWAMRRHLRSGAGAALLLGGAFLGGSLFTDAFFDDALPGAYLLEDALKLLGVFLWVVVPVLAFGAGQRPSSSASSTGVSVRQPRTGGDGSADVVPGQVLQDHQVEGGGQLDVRSRRRHEPDRDPHPAG